MRIFKWVLAMAILMISMSAFAAGETVIEYDADSRGGLYYTDVNVKPVRFSQLLEFIDQQESLAKFTLVARRDMGKLKSRNPVFKEADELRNKAFYDGFVFEDRNVRSVCADGYQRHIYNQGSVDIELNVDSDTYALGEDVELMILNTSQGSEKSFIVSAEKFMNGEWREVLFDITCDCRTDCLKMNTLVKPGEKKALVWNQEAQMLGQHGEILGCGNTPGKYRFKIMVWVPIPQECTMYNDRVYSKEFLIQG